VCVCVIIDYAFHKMICERKSRNWGKQIERERERLGWTKKKGKDRLL